MSLIDISPLVSERIGVFPGDVPYERRVSLSLGSGDHLELSAMHTTLHVGAHADAPSHYIPGGAHIAERSLDLYYGPCQVVQVAGARGRRVGPGDLEDEIRAPRVLFKTGSFPDPENFNEDFASLSRDLIEYLHGRKVQLVGIDTPSIDPCRDRTLESHKAAARYDLAVLEGIVLAHVDPGLYTLIALPLKLENGDAAPVRAALLKQELE